LNFLERFSENAQISTFIKIRPVGAELFHAGWRAGMTKLTVAFQTLAKALKNVILRTRPSLTISGDTL